MHIGNLIKQKFDESGMTITHFANLIHCSRQNVYSIFQRRTVEIELIGRISDVFDFDFLNYEKGNAKYLVVLKIDKPKLKEIEKDAEIKIMSVCKL